MKLTSNQFAAIRAGKAALEKLGGLEPFGLVLKQMLDDAAQPIDAEPVAWRVHPFDYGIGHEGVYALTMRPDQVKDWGKKRLER